MSVRTRFAPSPTGFMHVGGVRTALYSWLYARKHGGQFILRIEDTDKGREVEGSIGHIMECLKWLGIEWDEGTDVGGPHEPYLQSARLETYRTYAKRLIDAGFAYPDPYTEEEVEAFRQKAEEEKRPFLYRDHRPENAGEWDGTRPLRFKTPIIKRYEWDDAIRGPLSAGEEALDDFILIKGDGYPTYNFAHVVDDIEMEITHVMRGEEFISSTPKFLSLYDALEEKPPVFATMPVILGENGQKKLSKRDGAKDLLEYRDEGYLPEAMVNFLALLGWNPGTDQEIFGIPELVALFELDRVQKSGARFDEEKLLFVNREHMRLLTDEEFINRGKFVVPDPERLRKALPLLKERSHTLGEARSMLDGELSCLFTAPNLLPVMLVAKEPTGRAGLTRSALERALALVESMPEDVSAEAVKEAIMPLADEEEVLGKGGRGGVLWPLRYALSGSERSPDPFSLIYILGPAESAARIRSALASLSDILG
ncbi:MAG: glutamate--tRNA ligase [Parcubacteria bacterium C7867-004]|nr:MAG: glutamate--tRNA ligase [Parcubacteria bacterium C7867-004]